MFAPISIPARAAALAACASQLRELNIIDSKNVSRNFYPPAFPLYSSNLCIWSSENLYKCSSPSENAFTARTPIATARVQPGVRCASGARCGPVHTCLSTPSAFYFGPSLACCINTALASTRYALPLPRPNHTHLLNSCSSFHSYSKYGNCFA